MFGLKILLGGAVQGYEIEQMKRFVDVHNRCSMMGF